MRALTLTYLIWTVDGFSNLGLWAYLAVTWWMTVIFDFINQKKGTGARGLTPTLSSVFSAMIAFMVPVNLQEFTVLKTAMPRAAPLPFFLFRQVRLFGSAWLTVAFLMQETALQVEMLVLTIYFIRESYCEPGERDLIGSGSDCSAQITFSTAEALDKERTGGRISLLTSNALAFTTFAYLLVAVLPYEKSDRLHSGLRALVWDNKGLIGCLRCLPWLSHLGEASGDIEADESHSCCGGHKNKRKHTGISEGHRDLRGAGRQAGGRAGAGRKQAVARNAQPGYGAAGSGSARTGSRSTSQGAGAVKRTRSMKKTTAGGAI